MPATTQVLCRMHPSPLRRLGAQWLAAARLAVLGAATLFVAADPVAAADPLVVVTVVAIPTIVTYSRPAQSPPMPTYASYRVTVTNNSTNVLNNVRFTGTTSVVLGGAEVRSAPWREAAGIGCVVTRADRTAIDCAIGQLRGGGGAGASASFVVYFDAPAAVTAPVPCLATGAVASCDQIRFATRTFYAEGPNDNGGASHVDLTDVLASTDLGTPTTTEVRSSVPSGGATFSTGSGVPSSLAGDLLTTTVKVPSIALQGAQVVESVNPSSCSADVTVCFISEVTIPGSFAALEITLRRDVSTIATRAKIDNQTVFYRHRPGDAPIALQACSVTGGPQPGVPCIAARTEYTKRTAPTPELIGDWEFRILAVDNGRFFV